MIERWKKKRGEGFIWRKERGCTEEKGEKSGVGGATCK